MFNYYWNKRVKGVFTYWNTRVEATLEAVAIYSFFPYSNLFKHSNAHGDILKSSIIF